MPIPQLKVRCISASLIAPVRASHSNTADLRPALALQDAPPSPRAQHARDIVGEAAAGDVRQRMHRHRADQRQQ